MNYVLYLVIYHYSLPIWHLF